ncbi:MAG: glycoside hydrolase family 43 protein [Bacteroidaceae bacterium]|nr:glycoside hydrolase family 43 protein [Bacteroidaceae bacterium]
MKRRFLSLALFLLAAAMGLKAADAFTKYLFVYFPSNSDENIYYALSDNGFDYTPINDGQRFLAADTVALKKGLRDPHILRTDDGWFLMVATDMRCAEGWDSNRGMVLLKSRDLVHWQHSAIHFPDKYQGTNFANVTRVWAPETIYDPVAGKYMIYYSLLTNDGTIPYDRVYYNYANADFTDLEGEPTVLFDRGKSTIDMDIVYDNGTYHAFYKNEDDGGISKVTATQLTAPVGQEGTQWSAPSGKLQQTNVAVEGAGVFQLIDGSTWVLMYDCYTSGYYQFCTSTDLSTFTFKQNTYTSGVFTPRHGTVIPVTDAEVAGIQAAIDADRINEVLEKLIREVEIASQLGVDVSEIRHKLSDSSQQMTIAEMKEYLVKLNLAEYEVVTKYYTEDESSPLGEWETYNWSDKMSGQHYDGTSKTTYWEQSWGWGDTSWSMYMRSSVSLPAGNYVLKCAGRSASESTIATMSVDDQSVRFPTKGDVGYGIDTSGRANFSPDGQYANNGAGRGWEWRYLPFTLSEPRTVDIMLSGSGSGIHQWLSFTSLSLLRMPDELVGIDEVKMEKGKVKNESYDLSGRRISNPRGLYIVGKQKHIAK